ncbi:cytochrome P450 [Cladochytrium replicatum]|nr:cytochrome P450 [Cladochytrium replicatum]
MASAVAIVGTLLGCIITIVVFAIIADPTRVEQSGGNLPAAVPWSFILPHAGNIRNLFIEIRARYGDVVRIHFPFRGWLYLALGNDASRWFHSASTKKLDDPSLLVQNWLPTFPDQLPQDETSKIIIKSMNLGFNDGVLATLKSVLRKRVIEWESICKTGGTCDCFEQGEQMVLDVNTKMMFGDDWDEKDLADYKWAFLISDPGTWITNPVNLMLPFLGRDLRNRANKVLVDTTTRQAQKHVEKGLRPNECSLDFFLQELAPSVDKPAYHAWHLEMASFVTTANASSWLLIHLADDPSLQRRVREEIESIVPKDADLTIDHLSQMAFMESLAREVIRTHLPTAAARMAVSELEYEGLRIPKGSVVAFPHVSVHYSEDNYEDPFAFKPDRFLGGERKDELEISENIRNCTLLTFGAGRHPCLGMRLAMIELKVLAYEILTQYDLKLSNKVEMPSLKGVGFEKPKASDECSGIPSYFS